MTVHRLPRRHRENEGARASWFARHRADLIWVAIAVAVGAACEWIILRGLLG